MVEKILSDFKSGKRDYADFWLEINSRFVYIKYHAVRTGEGKYLGTLESTRDVTELRALQSERRIYSEE
ncbi:MAG: PAS domain-containing protein [Spirochaetales bacterium]|nr:PAS domain-containing protein [Spirochaetales bacterium]